MTPNATYVSRYERRIALVVDAVRAEPEAAVVDLPDDAARRLAARVLHALDHIPETIR